MSRDKRMRRRAMHSKLHFLFTEEKNWPGGRPLHKPIIVSVHSLSYEHSPYTDSLFTEELSNVRES